MVDVQFDFAGSSRKRLFTMLIFAGSAAPLLFYVVIGLSPMPVPNLDSLIFTLAAIGFVHVGMTIYFYVGDSRYNEIIQRDKLRYFVLPVILVAGSLAAFLLVAPQQLGYYVTAYLVWSIWHFNRQNFGLYAAFLNSEGQQPCSERERKLFDALCAGPMLLAISLLPALGVGEGAAVARSAVVAAGQTMLALSAVLLLAEAFRLGRFSSPIAAGWLTLSVLFFLPPAVSTNPLIAFTFYGHSIQFIVMMIFLAGASSERCTYSAGTRIAILLGSGVGALALFIGLLQSFPDSPSALLVAAGLLYGLAQWHFLVDAGVWRLRDPASRRNFNESFDFLRRR